MKQYTIRKKDGAVIGVIAASMRAAVKKLGNPDEIAITGTGPIRDLYRVVNGTAVYLGMIVQDHDIEEHPQGAI